MATWEDGPEYAPLERPDDFLVPPQAPLPQAPPYDQQAGLAPHELPVFADPPVPVAPLASLVAKPEPPRNPTVPFAVVSSAMTPSTGPSAWSAAHWQPPGAHPAPAGASAAPAGQAVLSSWPPPSAPLVLSTDHYRPPSNFPTPGTPSWFAPPPRPQPTAPPAPATFRDVVAGLTPGVVICLGIGALIHLLAPLTLAIAALLAGRARLAGAILKVVFLSAMGLLVVVAAVAALVGTGGFAGWWSAISWTALLESWVLLGLLPAVAVRALRRGQRPAPPDSTWN